MEHEVLHIKIFPTPTPNLILDPEPVSFLSSVDNRGVCPLVDLGKSWESENPPY